MAHKLCNMKKEVRDFGSATFGIAYRFEVANGVLGSDNWWHPLGDIPKERPSGESLGRIEHRPCLYRLRILKNTKCGYWVTDTLDDKARWCSNKTIKRYAYPTIEEAAENYRKRTEARIAILESLRQYCEHNVALFLDSNLSKYEFDVAKQLKSASLRPHTY